jgi:hypothetical protein
VLDVNLNLGVNGGYEFTVFIMELKNQERSHVVGRERILQHLSYYLGQYHINTVLICYGDFTWYVEPNGFENK